MLSEVSYYLYFKVKLQIRTIYCRRKQSCYVCICYVSYVLTVKIPLLQEFWQYESTYREQPDVHYRREAIVYLGGCQGQPDRVWSTYGNHLDMLYPETVVFPTVFVSFLPLCLHV